MSLLAFQMWEPMRQAWTAEHVFYVEQARKRLMSQFDNMEEEAHRAAERYLDEVSKFFDPEAHDPGDFYESANDKGIEFYQLLTEMHERTRLSVIAGMYHEWDKKLREWMTGELRHWHQGLNVAQAVWTVDISSLFDFFRAFGFDVFALPGYERLDAMRLVVNVFKHGDGKSFTNLKEKHPHFFPDPSGGIEILPYRYADYTNMKVTDEHVDYFSSAILEFLLAVPSEMFIKQGTANLPTWFEKAYRKDIAERQ